MYEILEQLELAFMVRSYPTVYTACVRVRLGKCDLLVLMRLLL